MAGAINHWSTTMRDELRQLLIQRYTVALDHVSGFVYDAGCGYGVGSALLAAVARRVHGMDLDPDAISTAAVQCEDLSNVSFAVGNIETMPVPACDWVICTEVLEHLVNPAEFVECCKIKLQRSTEEKRGMVVSVPIRPTVGNNPHHRHDFTAEQLDELFIGWPCVADKRLTETVKNEPVEMYKVGVYTLP